MQYPRLAGCGLLMLVLLLAGCGSTKNGSPKGNPGSKQPVASVPVRNAEGGLGTAPRTSDEWRTYGEQLKNERDDALRIAHNKDNEIEIVNQRIIDREQAEIRKEHAQEAAIGRRIAAICFGISTILTILSFLPIWWAKLIPKWAGPMGVAAGVALLAASFIWIWVADHIVYLSLGAGVIGVLVVLLIFKKGITLVSIRQWYQDLSEHTTSEAEEYSLKAQALEREIQCGVHAAGQMLRGKPEKTLEDVAKLRKAADESASRPAIRVPAASPNGSPS